MGLSLALVSGFPQTWVGFASAIGLAGGILGTVIAWLATKSERKKISLAHAETNKVYEQTIKAQRDYAATIQANHDAEIQRLTETNTKVVLDLTTERDSYRTKSHDLAGELQSCGLKIKEFEMRPDLTTLYHSEKIWHEQREGFYQHMFEAQAKLGETQQGILDICRELLEAIKATNGKIHAAG